VDASTLARAKQHINNKLKQPKMLLHSAIDARNSVALSEAIKKAEETKESKAACAALLDEAKAKLVTFNQQAARGKAKLRLEENAPVPPSGAGASSWSEA
jgi:hypothetical protein